MKTASRFSSGERVAARASRLWYRPRVLKRVLKKARLVFWMSVVTLAVGSSSVRADELTSADWRAGPTRVEVQIRSWGPHCGEKPVSTTVADGGPIRMTRAGDHLVLIGRRTTRTDACWSENRAVRRVSASVDQRGWKIVCRTAADDPRGEVGVYTLERVSEARFVTKDVSQYDWQLEGSRCAAVVTATQIIERQELRPTSGEAQNVAAAKAPSCIPGPATRIELRPARARSEPGQRTCFQARVVDAKGCALSDPQIAWNVERPETTGQGPSDSSQASIIQGCVRTREGSVEGKYRVTATTAGLTATGSLVVHAPDLSDLIASHLNASDDNVAISDSRGKARREGQREGTSSGPSKALRLMPTSTPPSLWIGLIAAAVIFAGLGVWLAKSRRQGPREEEDGHDGLPSAMPADDAIPYASPSPQNAALPVEPNRLMVCPRCRRGFQGQAKFCPLDAAELVPYEVFARRSGSPATAEAESECPRCGTRYPGKVRFCGKDGEELRKPG